MDRCELKVPQCATMCHRFWESNLQWELTVRTIQLLQLLHWLCGFPILSLHDRSRKQRGTPGTTLPMIGVSTVSAWSLGERMWKARARAARSHHVTPISWSHNVALSIFVTSKPLKKLYRTSLPGPDSCHLLKPNGWHGMDFFAVVSCFKSLKIYKHHLPEQLVLLSLVGCVLSCSCITQRPASVGALYCCLAQWITKILWYLMSLNASPSCQSCTCFFRRQRQPNTVIRCGNPMPLGTHFDPSPLPGVLVGSRRMGVTIGWDVKSRIG